MINREFILNHFTNNITQYQQYAKNIAGADDADDLFQECALMVLEFDEARLISYWNPNEGLKPFFIRMLCLQYKSKTSKYHKEYRKETHLLNQKGTDIAYNNSNTVTIEDYDNDISEVQTAANAVLANEHECIIWNLYVEHGSLRKALAVLPDKYKGLISLQAIQNIVQKFQREIKRQLNVIE